MTSPPLLQAIGLTKRFSVPTAPFRPKRYVHAVENISLDLHKGEILGLVGESGSGKTTVGRMMMGLMAPTSGEIRFDGQDISRLSPRAMMPFRQRIQMVFQDPFASLSPRRKVGQLIAEGMEIHRIGTGAEQKAEVDRLLDLVGLPSDAADRFPHEFSGGQRQRIGIARALAVKPEVLIADEPVSALDVSVQAQVLNLLQDLKEKLGLTILFISHDLAVVEHFCDRVAVMYLGNMMEIAPRDSLFQRPRHPYSKALLSAAPIPDPAAKRDRIILAGDIPSPINPAAGCVLRGRCPHALPACAQANPTLNQVAPSHFTACIRNDIL